MNRLLFVLRESFAALQRAKLSSFFSTLMIVLSFTLLGAFYMGAVQTERFLQYLKDKVEIEAFLSDSLSNSEVSDMKASILSINGVSSVEYISKQEAADIFRREFGQDINSVLDFNPLPASFKIKLKNEAKTERRVAAIASQVEKIPGIEKVRYRKILVSLIDRRVRALYSVMSGFGLALVLLSVFLVYNSMRLAISHRKKIIDTMKLVGASRMMVRLPFIIGGLIQGVSGGIIASGLIYGGLHAAIIMLNESAVDQLLPSTLFYLALVAASSLLGTISSLLATRKYIKESLV
ncbi:MAG: cell division protein FtsX [Candidatus Kryptoniota bacterium]